MYTYINKKAAEKGKKEKAQKPERIPEPKAKSQTGEGKVSSPNSPHRNVEKDVA